MRSAVLARPVAALACVATVLAGCAGARRTVMPGVVPSGRAIQFTAPGFDEVHDLHGDVVDPDLVVFMGGNEFMVLPDLLPAFRSAAPRCRRIFVETLPPGILDAQLRHGELAVGSLSIAHRPDVFTAGRDRVEQLERDGLAAHTVAYASNRLAIMVAAGNPKGVRTLADLGRADVRVATPDAAFEDIGKKVAEALRAAGGDELARAVLDRKVAGGSTHVTRIHHRETPRRILDGASDAGPVWRTEALHQRSIGHAIELVEIADAPRSTSLAAALADAPRAECAAAFVAFLASAPARAVLAQHGFEPPPGE